MLSWISGIGDAFVAILSYISFLVTSLIEVFVLIAQSFVFLTSVLGHIPPVLLVFASAGIGVTIFFQLVGR